MDVMAFSKIGVIVKTGGNVLSIPQNPNTGKLIHLVFQDEADARAFGLQFEGKDGEATFVDVGFRQQGWLSAG